MQNAGRSEEPTATIELPCDGGPWSNLVEIAQAADPGKWLLVGGLMVALHAASRGVEWRTTDDVDILIDFAAGARPADVFEPLESLGYDLDAPAFRNGAAHRMRRGAAEVDLLTADHLPRWACERAKWRGFPLLSTEGGAQAAERAQAVRLDVAGRDAEIRLPSLLGALVLKSAALNRQNVGWQRHAHDVALLSSLVEDPDAMAGELHGSDRKRLRHAWRELEDSKGEFWRLLPDESAERARAALERLANG